MKQTGILLMIGIALSVAGCGDRGGEATAEDGAAQGHELRLRPEEGRIYAYDFRFREGVGEAAEVAGRAEARTQGGVFVVRVDDLTLGGEPAPEAVAESVSGTEEVVRIDSQGRLVEAEDDSGSYVQQLARRIAPLTLPGERVQEGSTWQGVLDLGSVRTDVEARVIAVEDRDGRRIVRIEAHNREGGDLFLQQPAEIVLDLETGMLVRLEVDGVFEETGRIWRGTLEARG
jgi:hypothetical protein